MGNNGLEKARDLAKVKQHILTKASCLDHWLWSLSHCVLLFSWEERFLLLFQTDLKAETAYGKLTNGGSLEPDKHCPLKS